MEISGYIFDEKKYAIHDGPGIRTTVFFKGCPLNCWWCHNPECHDIVNSPGFETCFEVSGGEVMFEVEKDVIFYDQSGGGVTFSGGEPMMQMQFLYELLVRSREAGIHTTVDTSGFAPIEDFKKIYDLVDLFLYDLKIMDSKAHKKYTGVSNSIILKNLRILTENGSRIALRIPMIPGITDTEDNLKAILQFIKPLMNINIISLLPYNKHAEDKFEKFNIDNKLGEIEIPSNTEVIDKGRIFEEYGYKVRIGG